MFFYCSYYYFNCVLCIWNPLFLFVCFLYKTCNLILLAHLFILFLILRYNILVLDITLKIFKKLSIVMKRGKYTGEKVNVIFVYRIRAKDMWITAGLVRAIHWGAGGKKHRVSEKKDCATETECDWETSRARERQRDRQTDTERKTFIFKMMLWFILT